MLIIIAFIDHFTLIYPKTHFVPINANTEHHVRNQHLTYVIFYKNFLPNICSNLIMKQQFKESNKLLGMRKRKVPKTIRFTLKKNT